MKVQVAPCDSQVDPGCLLCGLPVPTQRSGDDFCCHGCREVYSRFGELSGIKQRASRQTISREEPVGSEAFLNIEGMHCRSCERLIESVALESPGIVAVNASFATSTVRVVYDADQISEVQLPICLSRYGYRARFSKDAQEVPDERMPLLRLVVAESLAATVMMLYLAFYYPLHLGLVEPRELEPVHWLAFSAVPVALMVLTTLMLCYVAIPIFRGAWIGLRTGILNMDNLLAIAILAAYGYSVAKLLAGSIDLYFDVVATIVAVVTIGRYLEREARNRATRALRMLMDSGSSVAKVYRDGRFAAVATQDIAPRDRILIEAGESVPVDGKVISGSAAVDESLMTGEPFPVNRTPGDRLLGGSRLLEGYLEIVAGHRVESQAENLARILWNTQSRAGGAQSRADQLARYFVPLVLALASAVTMWGYFGDGSLGSALLAGMATLIVSCPCTFGLAIPLTTAAGISRALDSGIIITNSEVFNRSVAIDTLAIDKTGVLSSGEMRVTDQFGCPEAVVKAAAVERLSAHPIATAIAALDSSLSATEGEVYPGQGVVAKIDGEVVAVGSRALFDTLGWAIPEEVEAKARAAARDDGVLSFVGWGGTAQGALITHDEPRAGWQSVIKRLREGCRVVLLSGAESGGSYPVQMDEQFCGIPPQGKAAVIDRLRVQGRVAMVGDGSNDAPALAAADIGIAFGTPTSLAAEAADIVIPGRQLNRLVTTLELIATVRRRIAQNLYWALLYNAVTIPLAVGGLLNPLFAALAMSSSSLLVIGNATRRYRLAELKSPEHHGTDVKMGYQANQSEAAQHQLQSDHCD